MCGVSSPSEMWAAHKAGAHVAKVFPGAAGGPAFEYQSLVAFEGPNAEGRMEGSFEFVPGTIARPEGEPFRVTVPEFRCRPAAYFY